MEVCVDSLESVINSYEGCANRIELCSSLNEGGLTPTYGLLRSVKKYLISVERHFEVYCMIRCRSGDFNYTDTEIETMIEDINKFVELEIDGLVFGALDPNGLVDESVMKEFLKLIPANSNIKTTFHRAFDVSSDWKTCFKQIKALGFDRILTSGQKKTAFEGRELIGELVRLAKTDSLNPISIMPGAGINKLNLEQLLIETKCVEFHASCRSSRNSKMKFRNLSIPMGSESNLDSEFLVNFTDKQKVKELFDIFSNSKC